MSLNSVWKEDNVLDSLNKKLKMYPPNHSTKDWVMEVLGSNEYENVANILEKSIGSYVYYLLKINKEEYDNLKIPKELQNKIFSSLNNIIQCKEIEVNDFYSLLIPGMGENGESKSK